MITKSQIVKRIHFQQNISIIFYYKTTSLLYFCCARPVMIQFIRSRSRVMGPARGLFAQQEETMQGQKKRKISAKRVVIIILTAVLVLLIAAGGAAASSVYSASFKRANTKEPQLRTIGEFKGLKVEECTFPSNRGQKLAGYKYSKENLTPKGVVIIAHGLGPGGQCVYMDTADYFTSNGYLVFAYDATGMDKSEGDSAIGMQQGVIDLDHAISYVEQDSEMKKYPIVLFGHSWGAYCVSTVLNVHPEVKAVAAVSGFNRPSDLYKHMLGKLNPFLGPYFNLYEKIRFGKYADYSSLSGFANTNAGIMIIQSEDDKNVPETVGYDLYYAKYRDDARFRFKLYKDRGHLYIFYTDAARKYDHQFLNEGEGSFTEYGKTHTFDKTIGYETDPDFFKGILDFYNEYCE